MRVMAIDEDDGDEMIWMMEVLIDDEADGNSDI